VTLRSIALLCTLLLVGGLGLAGAHAAETIELTAAELERLGIVWTRPEAAGQVVLTAPAVAVVPPTQEMIVSAPVGGLVTRLLVAEGSEVDEGDPLIELRSLELLGAQREYVDARAAARLAQAQLERDRMLHDEGIIARRRLDETAADALAARVRAEQARQQLRLIGDDDAALERLADTGDIAAELTLRAPARGVVIERHGAVGEQVEALEPIVRLADLGRLWLEARIPQERADAIAPGMQLAVTVRGATMSGEIFLVGRTVDTGTQTVLVRAEVANPDFAIRAGQLLSARVLAPENGLGAVSVPMSAVTRIDGQAYVFARATGGIRLVPITVIGDDGGRAQIAGADIEADAEIAARGVSALKALLTADEE
jgi:membrane fusion protein, heavy metal efflux system